MGGWIAVERLEELVAECLHPSRAGVGDVFGDDKDLDGTTADGHAFLAGDESCSEGTSGLLPFERLFRPLDPLLRAMPGGWGDLDVEWET